ncbi:MAG: copper ion binding protein [Spirochaetia bacterium]
MAKQTMDLNVAGMSCQHCVRAVKTGIEAVKGVEKVKVEVSLEKNLATVDFDPGVATLQMIKTAIEDQGYSVAEGKGYSVK